MLRLIRVKCNQNSSRSCAGSLIGAAAIALTPAAHAQETQEQSVVNSAEALSEDIVVTARKKASGELAQNVPLAVTAFGEAQLEAKFVRNLENLSTSMPNVQLVEASNIKGSANFSIRGLGVNSTIPSVEPTVGVFVDGVYQGVNSGIVFDNFDLEAIEVLRGPQGTLFGRNVTGGAVVLRTTTPGNDFRVNTRASVETGLNAVVMASVSGPLVPDQLAAKVAAYYRNDDGWWRNRFNNKSFGKVDELILRAALAWTPNAGAFKTVLKLEYGRGTGDGAPQQNWALFSPDTFDLSLNFNGQTDHRILSAYNESTLDVGFGDGVITNVLGYRHYRDINGQDLDATPQTLFHFNSFIRQEQFSNELRYAGTFGPVDLTAGLYYFQQDILYIEDRYLAGGAVNQTGGGELHQKSYAAFANIDWKLSDTISINVGGRYTVEDKNAQVARTRTGACNYQGRTCVYDVYPNMSVTFKGFTPKVGIQWQPTDATNAYAYYAKGLRSGGYNLRHSAITLAPGPTDQETQNSFEIGLKQEFGPGNRVNLAAFLNKLSNLQRETNVPDATFGAVQLFRNVADLEIKGLEAEVQVVPVRGLVLSGQLGYVHAQYSNVRFDLTGDGVINDADVALQPPRLSPWTYGIGATYDLSLGDAGVLTARGSFQHRDANFYTDNNLAILQAADLLDASLTYGMRGGRWSFSIYGKNLTNQVTHSSASLLPPTFGGVGASSSALGRGRVIGAELGFKY